MAGGVGVRRWGDGRARGPAGTGSSREESTLATRGRAGRRQGGIRRGRAGARALRSGAPPPPARARTLWCGCTSMKSGGTMDTASWRLIAPASVARFMKSWIAASHGSWAGERGRGVRLA